MVDGIAQTMDRSDPEMLRLVTSSGQPSHCQSARTAFIPRLRSFLTRTVPLRASVYVKNGTASLSEHSGPRLVSSRRLSLSTLHRKNQVLFLSTTRKVAMLPMSFDGSVLRSREAVMKPCARTLSARVAEIAQSSGAEKIDGCLRENQS